MTNQPIREALAEAKLLTEMLDVLDVTEPMYRADYLDLNLDQIVAAMSLLSTALAERDERIAELEEALVEIDDVRGGPAYCPELYQAKAIATRARLKLGKESSRG